VNGERLFPSATPATVVGDSVSWSDPKGRFYKGEIKIAFLAPVGAAPNMILTQLFYENEKDLM